VIVGYCIKYVWGQKMTEFIKPKVYPIENYPKKSKLFLKCVITPIVIFLIIAKIFSFGVFAYIFFAFTGFWFLFFYYFYEYGKTFFGGMNEQLQRAGEQFNYHNLGVWINSQDKTIILFDQDDQRLVKYPFDYITSVGHYNLIEDKVTDHFTTIGSHILHEERRTPTKREYQVNIGTRDPFKPNYCLKVLFPWRSPKVASEVRKLISADYYQ
jgi:hypothetical protein